MRCFKATTVVASGSGISSRRSGIEVVNLIVIGREGFEDSIVYVVAGGLL
jgi:hypothetical protein